MQAFAPRYLNQQELPKYGLPGTDVQANILMLVDAASMLIDEYCGRNDGDGGGSLVYTTYTERLILQAPGRNIVRCNFKPLAVVTPNVVSNLMASGSAGGDENNYYTGVQANTIVRPDLTVSPLLSLSGRYGYSRRGEQQIYPDLNYGINPLQLASYFGGPPNWIGINVSATDFDPISGEIWLPAGLYMTRYTEIIATYNSGYDPTNMPPRVKMACAHIVRNLLVRAGGVTGIKSLNAVGSLNAAFDESLIDDTVANLLRNFTNVIAM